MWGTSLSLPFAIKERHKEDEDLVRHVCEWCEKMKGALSLSPCHLTGRDYTRHKRNFSGTDKLSVKKQQLSYHLSCIWKCVNVQGSLKSAFLLCAHRSFFITFYLCSFEKAQCKQLKLVAGKCGWLTESFLRMSDWSVSFSAPGWRPQKTSCAWHLIHHGAGPKYEMTRPSDLDRGWSWRDEHNMVQQTAMYETVVLFLTACKILLRSDFRKRRICAEGKRWAGILCMLWKNQCAASELIWWTYINIRAQENHRWHGYARWEGLRQRLCLQGKSVKGQKTSKRIHASASARTWYFLPQWWIRSDHIGFLNQLQSCCIWPWFKFSCITLVLWLYQ